MPIRILCIEDEMPIQDMIRFMLEKEGFEVVAAMDGKQAREKIANQLPELMLVDWMLPDTNGIKLIKEFRRDEYTREIPMIMLTAKVQEEDMIEGLDSGADDYITKPVSMKTLLARINALLRRTSKFTGKDVLSYANVSLHTDTYQIRVDDNEIKLGKKDFRVLKFLMEHPERVFSRSQLLDFIWGRNHFLEERSIDVNMLRIRKALKPFGANKLIQTVRGAGYRLSKTS